MIQLAKINLNSNLSNVLNEVTVDKTFFSPFLLVSQLHFILTIYTEAEGSVLCMLMPVVGVPFWRGRAQGK